MKQTPKQLTVVQRDQHQIDAMADRIKTASEKLQRMIDDAAAIGAEVTAENWTAVMRTPEQSATELMTADLQPEMVGRFQRKRSAQIAELELPDLSALSIAAAELNDYLKRMSISLNMLTVQDGKAVREETAFQHYVDMYTIYASDPALWEAMVQLEAAINKVNALTTERNIPGIQPNTNRPLYAWFIIEPDGQVKVNPLKYQAMAGGFSF